MGCVSKCVCVGHSVGEDIGESLKEDCPDKMENGFLRLDWLE